MNKHLVDFIDDELKNNGYYENIRKFAEGKEWKYILSDVVNEYEDHIDDFGPYRFIDAIEDYLLSLEDFEKYENLDDVIDEMWEKDAFEEY